MCLSTIYRGSLEDLNILMKNVMKIECQDGMVILTDLMERQMALEGELVMANLVDGYALVRERAC